MYKPSRMQNIETARTTQYQQIYTLQYFEYD